MDHYYGPTGKDPISYGNSPTSAATVLPTGQQEDDYNLAINIYIKNAVGVAVVKILHVKVSTVTTVLFFDTESVTGLNKILL